MGVEIRLHLHISFISVSMYPKVPFADKCSPTSVSAKLLASRFSEYFQRSRRAVWGVDLSVQAVAFTVMVFSRDVAVAEPGCFL